MTGRHKRALRVGAAHGLEPNDWEARSYGCSGRMGLAVEHLGFGRGHVVDAGEQRVRRCLPAGT